MHDIEQESFAILQEALVNKVSDIHVYPGAEMAMIDYRIEGTLVRTREMSTTQCERLIAHYKFSARMDIGEKRRPQDGALVVSDLNLSLRLSTLPTVYGESLVLRLLNQEQSFKLSDLFLFQDVVPILEGFLQQKEGLLLLAGPTGSGKTTTLYTMLNTALTEQYRRIITVEDPVENRLDGIVQMEVNEDAGFTFEAGLKATLRHDPDMMMIGEIRDERTAKLAVNAALTGRLVVTTIHAADVFGVIQRLLAFGLHETEIVQTVQLVCCQRLVPVKKQKRRLAVMEVLQHRAIQQTITAIQQQRGWPSITSLKALLYQAFVQGEITEATFRMMTGGMRDV